MTYAANCQEITQITIPEFTCSEDGIFVPSGNIGPEEPGGPPGVYGKQVCDFPNVLNGECDPGSNFHVLAQTDQAVVVAHCRSKGKGPGLFGDIAIIQYNKENGATCFYQAWPNLGGAGDDLPDLVTAPIQGGRDVNSNNFPWLSPAETASFNCVACHDNGAIIRSPYLSQLRNEPIHRLPGTNTDDTTSGWGAEGWNQSSQPYKFLGNDFQSWKVYEVKVANTSPGFLCQRCHRLGISKRNGNYNIGSGTAMNFGPIATAETQASKTSPHSAASPIWMLPGQNDYVPAVETAALDVASCAQAIANGGTPPAGCTAQEYGQGDTCQSLPSTRSPSELSPVNPVGLNQ